MRDINRIPVFIATYQRELRAHLEEAGADALRQIDRGFDQGADAMGRPWQPLSPATIARKGNAHILEDTGEMRESFSADVDYDPLAGRYRLTLSSDSELLPYHEFGAPDVGLPKRPVLAPAGEWLGGQKAEAAITAALDASIKTSVILSF